MNYTIESISEFIDKLLYSERERFVLKERLEGTTLKEIGKNIKTDRESRGKKIDGYLEQERVRQIEAKGIRRIKQAVNFYLVYKFKLNNRKE